MSGRGARSACRWTCSATLDAARAPRRDLRGQTHSGSARRERSRISSNILADRLAALVEHGLLTRSGDPTHKQKVTYSLTEAGVIELVPVLAEISAWDSSTSRRRIRRRPPPGRSSTAVRGCGRRTWTTCARSTSASMRDSIRRPTGRASATRWPAPRRRARASDSRPGRDGPQIRTGRCRRRARRRWHRRRGRPCRADGDARP